jgi:hypothetical protein
LRFKALKSGSPVFFNRSLALANFSGKRTVSLKASKDLSIRKTGFVLVVKFLIEIIILSFLKQFNDFG